jgi:hypothetical protein
MQSSNWFFWKERIQQFLAIKYGKLKIKITFEHKWNNKIEQGKLVNEKTKRLELSESIKG